MRCDVLRRVVNGVHHIIIIIFLKLRSDDDDAMQRNEVTMASRLAPIIYLLRKYSGNYFDLASGSSLTKLNPVKKLST